KISHSSHELRTDNIKGSFNGTDISTEYKASKTRPRILNNFLLYILLLRGRKMWNDLSNQPVQLFSATADFVRHPPKGLYYWRHRDEHFASSTFKRECRRLSVFLNRFSSACVSLRRVRSAEKVHGQKIGQLVYFVS